MNTSDLIQAIKSGVYDADIQTLKGEILNRAMLLQADYVPPHVPMTPVPYTPPARVTQNINDFRIGKKVRINDRAATGYLRGQTAVVIKVKRSRVTIRLDRGGVGRFVDGTVTCPIDLLTIIS